MDNNIVYKSSGIYLGFIKNDYLFSRDGIYLGWIEGNFVWDSSGKFRGVLTEINHRKYILINRFSMPPVARTPKPYPNLEVPPSPSETYIPPITLPVGVIDSY